jgi:hypothetical protein
VHVIPTLRDGTPDGSLVGWEFAWKPDEHGMTVVASLQKDPMGVAAYVAGTLLAASAFVAHGSGRTACIAFGGLAVAFGGSLRRPVTLSLARDRVALKTSAIRSIRSFPTEDVFQFQVTRQRESEGGETFAIAMHVGCELIPIWRNPRRSAAEVVCNHLNEALFLVLTPPKSAPYR